MSERAVSAAAVDKGQRTYTAYSLLQHYAEFTLAVYGVHRGSYGIIGSVACMRYRYRYVAFRRFKNTGYIFRAAYLFAVDGAQQISRRNFNALKRRHNAV